MRKLISFVCFAVLSLAAMAGGEPTKQDAVAIVEKAVALSKASGKAKALEAVNTTNGDFHKGELYVLAYDFSGTIVAHPVNAKLVGKNMFDVPDTDGKYFRRDIVELAKTKKGGWVDYKYKNPTSGKIEAKTTYVLPAGDVIFAAGIYKD